jgi:hypothetical protein
MREPWLSCRVFVACQSEILGLRQAPADVLARGGGCRNLREPVISKTPLAEVLSAGTWKRAPPRDGPVSIHIKRRSMSSKDTPVGHRLKPVVTRQGGKLMYLGSQRRIFTLSKSVIIPMLCALLLGFSAVSEAWTTSFNYTATGSFEPGFFLFPDGNSSDSIALPGFSTVGPITLHEWDTGVLNGKTCAPPSGVPNAGSEVTVTDSVEVIRLDSTGDLLIQTLVSGTNCIDFSSGAPPYPFAGVLTVKNDGGTGKFAGARGTETLNFAGKFLSCGNNGCIGYVQQNETGTLTTH